MVAAGLIMGYAATNVTFVSNDVDIDVCKAYGTPAGGELALKDDPF
jgi:hypothetical protein